jgi:hypothetical protein
MIEPISAEMADVFVAASLMVILIIALAIKDSTFVRRLKRGYSRIDLETGIFKFALICAAIGAGLALLISGLIRLVFGV